MVSVAIGLLLALWPAGVNAQFWPSVGGRTLSRDGQWMVPVIGGILSSDEDDHLARGSVYAWDVSAPYGSFVFPMAAGRVSYAGCNNAGGYGCWVLLDHGDGYLSLYGHMIDEGAAPFGSVRGTGPGLDADGPSRLDRNDQFWSACPLGNPSYRTGAGAQ
ncbi:MAG: M23 family metallopeptidase [Caldilineaceae bacterium]